MKWIENQTKSIYNEIWNEPIRYPLLRRVLALFVDYITLHLFNAILVGLETLFSFNIFVFERLIINAIFIIGYFSVLNSALFNGKTLGKKLAKISVINNNGSHITVLKSFFRSLPVMLLFLADFVLTYLIIVENIVAFDLYTSTTAFLLILEVLFILININRKSFHDFIFSTQVIAANNNRTTTNTV